MDSLRIACLVCATALYVVHALTSVVGFLRSSGPGAAWRWVPLLTGLVLHSIAVVSGGIQAGGLPVASRLDSVALFLWLTAVVFLAAARPYGLRGAAPLFWPVFAAGVVAMWVFASREPAPRSSFQRLWLCLHLVPVYVGYAGFAVAAGAGLAYLCQERLLRGKGSGALWRKLPSLATLERVDRAAISLGFPALTLGLVVGVLWAEQSSELLLRAWYADPKVVVGLVVWFFYAAVLHIRLFVRLRGRRAALLTLAGFVLTLASFAMVHVYSASRAPVGGGAPRQSVQVRARP